MRISWRVLVCGVCVAIAACAKSTSQPVADGGSAGTSGHLDAGGDDAGDRDAGDHDAGSSSCTTRAQQASGAVSVALAAAKRECTTRADCEQISIDTDCHAACGALVSKTDTAAINAVIAAQNEGVCGGFEDDGCKRIIPPCVAPRDFDCVAGRCTEIDGVPADGCIDQALSWGPNGGLVAYEERSELATCRTFRIVRMTPGDPPILASCENEVDSSAATTVDAIDRAVADADVQAAITRAPVLYGQDSRPVDGTVFRIDIGGATIDVGDDCAGSSGCTAIPAGVAALRIALQALTDQQRPLPTCDALH
jgi:hypothetical protein